MYSTVRHPLRHLRLRYRKGRSEPASALPGPAILFAGHTGDLCQVFSLPVEVMGIHVLSTLVTEKSYMYISHSVRSNNSASQLLS